MHTVSPSLFYFLHFCPSHILGVSGKGGTISFLSMGTPSLYARNWSWLVKSLDTTDALIYPLGVSNFLYHAGDSKYIIEAEGYYGSGNPVYYSEGQGARMKPFGSDIKFEAYVDTQAYHSETLVTFELI